MASFFVPLPNGEKIEIIHGVAHFDFGAPFKPEGGLMMSERSIGCPIEFSQELINAEVFLSGIDFTHANPNVDYEAAYQYLLTDARLAYRVHRIKVDFELQDRLWVDPPPPDAERLSRTSKSLLVKYALFDGTAPETEAWVSYTVIAHTRPL